MRDSLEIDAVTGDITITDNTHLDRETRDSKNVSLCRGLLLLRPDFVAYVMVVEAKDENGKFGLSRVARTRLVINIEDVNDVPPLFKKRKYEGFMSSDLSRLRNNLQVEAIDNDKRGTQNSDVRWVSVTTFEYFTSSSLKV